MQGQKAYSGSGSASTLGLLNKHRQARELLARNNSIFEDDGQAPIAGTGLPPRMARPQSASGLLGGHRSFSSGTGPGSATFTATRRPRSATIGGSSHSVSQGTQPAVSPGVVSAASRHFHSSPVLGSNPSGAASNPTTTRRRPLSACASTGSVSPVGGRPGSASGLRERLARPASAGATSSWYCPQAAAMVRDRQHQAVQQTIQNHREQFPLPHQQDFSRPESLSPKSPPTAGLAPGEAPRPPDGARCPPPEPARVLSNSTSTPVPAVRASTDLPSQGPPLLSSLSQNKISHPGVAPPLPPLPPELEIERAIARADAKVSGAAEAKQLPDSIEEGEESRPEMDNASFDQTFTPEELRLEGESEEALNQLEAIDAAVEALRMQLELARDDIESSKSELAQLRSAADSWVQAAEEGTRELKDREQRLDELLAVLPADDEDQPQNPATARREEQESRQTQLAAERLKVVASQTERLQDQVVSQQSLLAQRLEERRALEAQFEALTQERDAERASQQEARAALRAVEQQLKSREEVSGASAQRRQDLERQAVRLRGEARGIRVRLDAQPPQEQTFKPKAPGLAHRESSSTDINSCSTSNGESSHACSLKLQHEVVALWAAMKRCDEEAADLEAALQEAESQELLAETRALMPQTSC